MISKGNNCYEDSKIPNDWECTRLKNVLTISDKTSLNPTEEKILSLTNKGIVERDITSNKGQLAESYDKYTLIKEGQICMNPMDLWSGWVDISSYDGLISPAYYTFLLIKKFDSGFINYFLQLNYINGYFFTLGRGVASHNNFGRWVLTPEMLYNIQIYFPDINQQKLISRYLDKKTAQIDLLIEKIQKKIELLKEQRISLINQCVTKGLDPSVEMKDSGVEWIGEIPEHWKLTKLKYICPNEVQYGLNIESEYYQENGVRFIRITDITSDGRLKETDGVYLSQDDVPEEYYLQKYDILFSRTGGTVGKSIRIEDLNSDMSFAGYLVRFSFEDGVLSEFVKLVSESGMFWKWIDIQIIQSTIQNVNGEKYSNFTFPLPSNDEIRSINRLINDKVDIIKKHIINHESKIRLLLEYRQSIISSVVTGKVRVTENML
tara:strand:+ start:1892 stop:3193 length:1302 start_codon:yes stop_codon:yes gene_type:complete